MRIGFDARYINDQYHGIGRYAFRMLSSLVRHAEEHTFVMYLGQGKNSRFDWSDLSSLPNVEFHNGPWPLYWPLEQLKWPLLLNKNNIDLFHTPYFVAPLSRSLSGKHRPVVITVHDLIFDRYPAYMPARWMRPYYKSLMWLSIRRADAIVTVSKYTSQDLTHFYHPPANRILIIPEGVDPGFQPLSVNNFDKKIRNRYHLHRPFVLSVGARRPHKNLSRLVHAFTRLLENIPHDLVFIGPTDKRFPDDALISSQVNQLNGRVRFLDWVPEEDLPKLYQLADLVVLPSIIEGFGLPALEAMACGTPVAVADNTSYPEVVGQAGMYFNPNNTEQIAQSIAGILKNPNIHRKLCEAGIRRAGMFTWESAADKIVQNYTLLKR